MPKQTTAPARTSDDPQPNGFAARSTGSLIIKKVSICEVDINGYHPFVLDTNQTPSKLIHVHPNKDPEIYRDMIALVPAIDKLRFNEANNRVITLRDYWQVSYKWEKRSFDRGMKEVMVATAIKVLPSKRTDLPEWMASAEELRELAADYNFGPDFMDDVLGLPRSSWTSLEWCREKLEARKKEITEQIAGVKRGKPAEQPPDDIEDDDDDIEGDRVYHEVAPHFQKSYQALVSTIKPEENEADKFFGPKKPANEPPAPPYNWTLFWVSVRNLIAANDLVIDDQHEYVHKFFDVPQGGSLKDSDDPADMLRRLSVHFNGISCGTEKTLDISTPNYPKESNNVTAPETTTFTADEWKAWIDAHSDWSSTAILEALNDNRQSRNLSPISKASEWDLGLDAIEGIVDAYEQRLMAESAKEAARSDETQPSAPTEPVTVETPAQPPKSSAGNPFKPASFEASKLRMALTGPSGSGKTFTALKIATNIVPNARVALIDTERGSASKYAKLFKFDVLELRNYHPDAYMKAIRAAADNGYDVLIIDSLSHAWNGDGGVLSIVDKKGGRFDAWKDVTPLQLKLVDTMLDAQLHIIATMRSKTEYVVETNERGKAVPRKVGLAPVQRDGMEYEFDVFGEISIDSTMSITKSRCPDLTATEYPKAGAEIAAILGKWLSAA